MVRSPPGQIVLENISPKNPSQTYTHTKRIGGVAQDIGPEFKPNTTKKKKKVKVQVRPKTGI
jgi:hypothetical protein